MMMDADIVHVKPSTVYRVLCRFGVIRHWSRRPSRKGGGFEQPLRVHEYWHMDITYVHARGHPYYMITIIDGCSRFIVAWGLFATMEAGDVGIVQQRAREAFPQARPRHVTDNGRQFVGKEFKEFIAMHGYTHVTTSVCYPQSNGKIERWHKSLKLECVHRKCLTDLDHARLEIAMYIDFYNERRLHSAIGYVTPRARLEGRHVEIQADRHRKIEEARKERGARFDIAENANTVRDIDEAEAGSAGTQHAEE
jgi:transposase InsO family protein